MFEYIKYHAVPAESMPYNNSSPGCQVVRCSNCGYYWSYSGSQERATCPSCSIKSPVPEHQLGVVLGEDLMIQTQEYTNRMREVIQFAVREGDDEVRSELADVFPTEEI